MNEIKYYKTYEITFKVPNNEHVYKEHAWPSCNDNGEIIWTLCEDNSTIISNKYVIGYKLI